jgi:hypothetical protein
MSARRRAAFLRALEGCGNVTLAAERAGVSRGWVAKARGLEPAFEADCRAAIAAAAAYLEAAEANRPARKGWGTLDGVQLVVRGSGGGTGGGSGGRRVQIARARAGQITPVVENRFLAVLAATCNVKAAIAAAGISKGSAYTHRKRWPGFAERWDAAVEEGAVRLEFALAAHARNLFAPVGLPAAAEMPQMSADEILHNLHMHQYALAGIGRRPGRRGRPPDIEAVHAKVVKVVEAIRRGRAVDEAELARGERERALRLEESGGG